MNMRNKKLSQPPIGLLLLLLAPANQLVSAVTINANIRHNPSSFSSSSSSSSSFSSQTASPSRLLDKCCQLGSERAVHSPRLSCKLSGREKAISMLGLPASNADLLAKDSDLNEQCELILESCCIGEHRRRNCDSGKQFAKSGSSCLDVELSKQTSIATESFNDCCMSCSLGVLAARNGPGNETANSSLLDRCKLMSPLASSLSGQLYEQTYIECCQENLPRPSSALSERGRPIDCDQSNPCSQRCVPATNRLTRDKCDCFSGYKLATDGLNCIDIDECKTNQHTCTSRSEVCDNIAGGYRCLARASDSQSHSQPQRLRDAEQRDDLAWALGDGQLSSHQVNHQHHQASSFMSTRLCPIGSRWNSKESKCE